MIHIQAIKRIFEEEKAKIEEVQIEHEYMHFGMTCIQKATELVRLFGKEDAIIYCNERLNLYNSLSKKMYFDKHIKYWNKIKIQKNECNN